MKSKNNWNKTVNTINKNRFVIPDGWDTKEQVAESLECAPDRVSDLLKPGIHAGEIEQSTFPVWNEARRMAQRVTCYRVVGAAVPVAVQKKGESLDVAGATLQSLEEGRVRACIRRNPTWCNSRVAKSFKGVRAVDVKDIREATQ